MPEVKDVVIHVPVGVVALAEVFFLAMDVHVEVLVQLQYVAEIFFLILYGIVGYGEFLRQFDVVVGFVLVFEMLEGVDDFRFLHHVCLETVFRKDIYIFEKVDGTVEHVDLVGTRDVVVLIVNVFHEVFAKVQVVRCLEIAVGIGFQAQEVVHPV